MKRFIMFGFLTIGFALLQGCYSGATKDIVYNPDKTEAYQIEKVKVVSFFAPTFQYERTKGCGVKKTLIKSNDFGSGYTKYSAVDCKLLTKEDGWNKDLGTPTGPTLMRTGTGVGAAVVISEGLKDSGNSNTVNNVNQQGQVQGQTQGQAGGGSGGCRGNCGGGNSRR
jgi:hypothetical protein